MASMIRLNDRFQVSMVGQSNDMGDIFVAGGKQQFPTNSFSSLLERLSRGICFLYVPAQLAI